VRSDLSAVLGIRITGFYAACRSVREVLRAQVLCEVQMDSCALRAIVLEPFRERLPFLFLNLVHDFFTRSVAGIG
jgi:hypothetical protein